MPDLLLISCNDYQVMSLSFFIYTMFTALLLTPLCRDLKESPLECMNPGPLAAFQHSPSCLLKKKKKKRQWQEAIPLLPPQHSQEAPPIHWAPGRQAAWWGQTDGTRGTRSILQPAFAATTSSTLLTQV